MDSSQNYHLIWKLYFNYSGYTGWDCTDISSTITPTSFFMSATLLILSNVFFIPAICIAIKRKLYVEGLVYLATMLFSSLYHACDQNGQRFCIAKYEVCHIFFIFKLSKFRIWFLSPKPKPWNIFVFCWIITLYLNF